MMFHVKHPCPAVSTFDVAESLGYGKVWMLLST